MLNANLSAEMNRIADRELQALELHGHMLPVRCVCSSGGILFTGSEDCTLRRWDATKSCSHVGTGHLDWVTGVITHGDAVFTASADHTVVKKSRPILTTIFTPMHNNHKLSFFPISLLDISFILLPHTHQHFSFDPSTSNHMKYVS